MRIDYIKNEFTNEMVEVGKSSKSDARKLTTYADQPPARFIEDETFYFVFGVPDHWVFTVQWNEDGVITDMDLEVNEESELVGFENLEDDDDTIDEEGE